MMLFMDSPSSHTHYLRLTDVVNSLIDSLKHADEEFGPNLQIGSPLQTIFSKKMDVGITSCSLKVKSFWNPANHIKSVRAGGSH